MLWTPVPPALTLREGEETRTWEFLTVVGSSQAEARACLSEALELQARGALYPTHAQAWAQLWADCGLDVVGPLPLRQALRGALYYLLSALPEPGAPGYVCHGLSPGGLSNGSREECYWGHVFWDQVCTLRPSTCTAGVAHRQRVPGSGTRPCRAWGLWLRKHRDHGHREGFLEAVASQLEDVWESPGKAILGRGPEGTGTKPRAGEGLAPGQGRGCRAHEVGRAVVGGLRAP